jgi:type I restriction enzyme S subunit
MEVAVKRDTVKKVPSLRFSGFKDAWDTHPIGHVFNVSAGGDVSKENVSRERRGQYQYPIYANAETNDGLFGYSDIYTVTEPSVTVSGRGNIGTAHARDGMFYPIVRLIVLTPKRPQSVQFFEHAVNRLNIHPESTGVPQLTAPQISGYTVTYPTLPEQQKIAAFLGAVDRKIQQLKRKQELLEWYKQGVVQKLFSQELRFKRKDGGEFPEWEEKRLGDLCVVARSGGTPLSTVKEYYDGDIPFLSISDMTEQGKYLTRTSRTISQRGIENSSSWIVPANSLIYSMYASVGFVAINKIPMATSQAVMNLILKPGINIDFVYYHLDDLRRSLAKFIETGTQGNMTGEAVKSLVLKVPSLEEQARIAGFLMALDAKVAGVAQAVAAAQQWKRGLLQQMFV